MILKLSPPPLWKNCLPQNWSLGSKRLGPLSMEWNLHKIEGMRGDHNLTEEQNSYVNWTKNPC